MDEQTEPVKNRFEKYESEIDKTANQEAKAEKKITYIAYTSVMETDGQSDCGRVAESIVEVTKINAVYGIAYYACEMANLDKTTGKVSLGTIFQSIDEKYAARKKYRPERRDSSHTDLSEIDIYFNKITSGNLSTYIMLVLDNIKGRFIFGECRKKFSDCSKALPWYGRSFKSTDNLILKYDIDPERKRIFWIENDRLVEVDEQNMIKSEWHKVPYENQIYYDLSLWLTS